MVHIVDIPYVGFLHISCTIIGEVVIRLITNISISAILVIIFGSNLIDHAHLPTGASHFGHYIQNILIILKGIQILLHILLGIL